jgi:hypothetical protein
MRKPPILIGSKPNELINLQQKSVFKNDIYFITDLSDEHINSAYSGLIAYYFRPCMKVLLIIAKLWLHNVQLLPLIRRL